MHVFRSEKKAASCFAGKGVGGEQMDERKARETNDCQWELHSEQVSERRNGRKRVERTHQAQSWTPSASSPSSAPATLPKRGTS